MRVDFVIGLTKKQLIAETLRLEFEMKGLRAQLESVELQREEALRNYHEQLLKQEERLGQLLDQRLGINQAVQEKKNLDPIKMARPSWANERATFEARKRKEALVKSNEKEAHWKKKIAEAEGASETKG